MWIPPDIAAIVEHVTHRTGLALSPAQLQVLTDYVARRQLNGAADFIACLADPPEFRALIDSLTVSETYFFRFEAQLDAFRDFLLPRFVSSARDHSRPVRVWSAGCCTGEEAYTLAIIAAEAGHLDRMEILATDINERYLEAAMAGEFSKRSVEKLPPGLLQKYFERRGDRFMLAESMRSRVTFKWLNLAESAYPSFLNGTAGLDMIFCRNVLIYFDKSRIAEIIDRFGECLIADGMLALGHSEMLPRDWTLSVQQVGEAFFYRRRADAGAAVAPDLPLHQPGPPVTPLRPRRAPMPAIARRPPAPPRPAAALLDDAETLANQGKYREASQMCREAIRLDASLERGHYLLGLLSIDRPPEALEHFRRAIALDPAHLPARLHLAECAEKTGRISDAVLEYRHLERLARARPPEEILDAREGITYGMLALIGESARRRLE